MQKLLHFILLTALILTTISCAYSKSQNAENNAAIPKSLSQIEKLSATAKVWGFLKYYHPQVAKGKFNWDGQLFMVLQQVEKAKTSEDLSEIFSSWIDRLGEVNTCTSCLSASTKEVFTKNFDLSWIDSENFSKELSKKLRHIEKNRVQQGQYYVSATKEAGNIVVQNEPEYANFSWKEKNMRLLALFRYWNQVEYFFPYKYQMDRDWNKTLEVLLTKFLNAGTEQEYHLAMLELTTSIDDSHGQFITQQTNQYYGYHFAPVKLKMLGNCVIVSAMYDEPLAKKDDWQAGDILTAVEGIPVSKIIKERLKYMPGSNKPAKYRGLEISLLNGSTTSTEIEILRAGKLQKKSVSRYLKSKFKKEIPDAVSWKMLDDNIGYVNMEILERDEVSQIMEGFKSTKAIIFDIRNYPKGTLEPIANEINTQSRPFVKFTIPDLNYPGKYTWNKPLEIGKKNPDAYKGWVILLANEDTQSHAEFTLMALQTAPDVTVIGSQTAGADGNIVSVPFVGGFYTYFSGIGVYYPDGRQTQRIGIVPDIEVKPTLEGLKAGKDEVLEKALEVIQKRTSERL